MAQASGPYLHLLGAAAVAMKQALAMLTAVAAVAAALSRRSSNSATRCRGASSLTFLAQGLPQQRPKTWAATSRDSEFCLLAAAMPRLLHCTAFGALLLARKQATPLQRWARSLASVGGRRTIEVAMKAEGDQSEVSQIDFRVGKIVSVEKHPDSEKLLIEQIDVGEDEPRTICSGIAQHLSLEDVANRMVVVVSNLKARKLGGVSSNGMLLCATAPAESEGELGSLVLVEAPEGAEVGERVVIEVEDEVHGEGAPPNRVAKKKLYEKVAPHLCTDEEGTVCYKASPFMTSSGPCTAKAIPKGIVS